uniref:Actin regulatory protein n=1 Tax=Kalmanozyma brasiliensis (strain GHG001) TaxID=1365824 RepID=V5EUM5_KALBG
MPSSSTISSSDKSKVKSAIPSSSNKIIMATVGRVYAAHPAPSQWSYAGVEGAIVFVRDLVKATFYFKVVDLKGTRGVIWEHEFYEGFQYNQDRTFFHSFEGDECLIGFSFADESEASDLFKKVNNRSKYAKSKSSSSSSKKKKASSSGKIDKSMIGAPSGFKHVAHMGFSAEHGFSSENVDPTWQALLEQLGSLGISEKDIRQNESFIKDFVGKRGGPGAAAKPAAPAAPKAKKVPPPAPTSKRKAPPPPPAPRSRHAATASTASASSVAPPPPPPPPRSGSSAPLPPPQDGRNALLASIQGKSVHNLKRTDASAPPAPGRAAVAGGVAGAAVGAGAAAVASGADSPDAGGGDGDLASALAAALSQRKENMGDSDEEGSDDDW